MLVQVCLCAISGCLSYQRTDFIGRKRTIIQNEQDTQQFPLGGVGEIESGVSLLDTDGDGMPDEFEDGYGLDKNIRTMLHKWQKTDIPILRIIYLRLMKD